MVEKAQVERLLKGLCEGIVQPLYTKGRPPLTLADVVYGATMKVYSTFSGRRATTDIQECKEKGLIDEAPHYNSIFSYLRKPELTPILKALIQESASPLKSVESQFAINSSCFSTVIYRRWFDHKHSRNKKEHIWIKAHAITGTRTNVVTAVRISEVTADDSSQMPPLLADAKKLFNIEEVSADRAYLSPENVEAVDAIGAIPYIPFLKHSRGDEGPEAWKNMYHLFHYKHAEFQTHYGKRSNAEATFSMIKRKFGASVRSKLFSSQVNEVLCKILCHNLSVLNNEIHELGIEPTFWMPRIRVAI